MFFQKQEPVIIWDGDSAQRQLAALESVCQNLPAKERLKVEQEIKMVAAGIAGERQIMFELQNSHLSLCILHDLHLKFGELEAQIDFLVVTPKRTFVLECKNLIGDIEITNKGEFIRSTSYGGRNKRECIYSPITQNKRHLELLREIKLDGKGLLKSLTINSNFDDVYRSFIVLANPKTILKDRYATKEVKSQVIRADQLIDTIRRINDEPGVGKTPLSWNMTVELAESFLQYHYEHDIEDAIQQRFEEIVSESAKSQDELPMPSSEPVKPILQSRVPSCPVCGSPMILRTAKRGKRAGNQFYGCSNYPHCRGIINLSEEPER